MVLHGSGAVSAIAGAGSREPGAALHPPGGVVTRAGGAVRRIAAAVLVVLAAAAAFDVPSAVAQHTLVTATATRTLSQNAAGNPVDVGRFALSGDLGGREFLIRNTVGSAYFSRFALGSIRLDSGILTLLIANYNNVSGSPSQLQHYNPLRDLTLRLGGVDYDFSSASQHKQRSQIFEIDPVPGSSFTDATRTLAFEGTVHRYRWTTSRTIGIGAEQAVTLKVPNTYPTMFGSHGERRLTRNLAERQHDDASGWAVRNIGEPIYAQDREHGSVLTYSIENLRANNGRSQRYRSCFRGTACADGVFAVDSSTGQIKTVSGKQYGLTTYRVLARVTDSHGATVGQYVTIRLSTDISRARLTSAEVGSGGGEVSLNFNRTLDNRRPSLGAFRVTVIGEDGEGNPAVVSTPRIGGVSVDGADKRVRLTGLSPAIESGEVVRVLYSTRSWTSDTPIRDTIGNEAYPILNVLVTNPSTSTAHSPLTAAFSGAPESHVGPVAFTLQLTFADPVTAGADDIRGAIAVTNGALTAVAPGGSENTLWNLTVTPSSTAAVTVTLAASPPCGEDGAICTADGRRVEAAVETTVRGAAPVRKGLREERVSEAHTLSIADAAAAEGGSLAFTVTLAPAATDEVTVDWATADGPSPDGAAAGSDYTAGSGTLTFAAGETSKTVTVAVLDDSADEISETVTVTLSNASGAGIGDGGATGTLADNDGPAPLTARFANAPAAHDGSGAISLRIGLDAALSTSWKGVRHSLAIANGTLTRIHRIGGRSDLWGIDVEPAGDGEVTVRLNPSADCADPATTMCAAGGRRIETAVSTVIPGPAPVDAPAPVDTTVPLTATFANAPAAHDGSGAISLRIGLDAALSTSWKGVRHSLAIANGTLTRIHRIDGRSDLWGIDVAPAGDGDVTVRLNSSVDCADPATTMCASGGRRLETAVSTVIPGPATVDTPAPVDPAVPLTARFVNMPSGHDAGSFAFRILFSEPLARSYSYETMRDSSVRVTQGGRTGGAAGARRVDGRNDLWEVTVDPASRADISIGLGPTAACTDTVRLNPSADCADPATTMCAAGGRRIETAVSTVIPGPAPVDTPVDTTVPLTATFANAPAAHDGSGAISLRIGLDAALSTSWKGVRHSLAIANGTLTRIHRIDGRSDLWGIDVAPAGDGDVTVRLNPSADCADPATTMCASGGRRLETAVSTVIPGPAPVDTPVDTTAPLTARFVNMPSGHDSGSFTFRILFSEPLARSYSYETMRDSAVRVTQGGRTGGAAGARRVDGRNDLWEVTVDPASRADIAIGLGPTAACTDTGAMCTGGGKALSGGLQASVIGLPGLSVADARVREAANATVDFAVTLSRAAGAAVTVDYATSDGTATAGADYRATTGTLTFVSGETAKTVSVAVIEDDHDEGEEIFTLTLSNASGGNAWLKDATATGAIENTDAMPQAWLARFGRTVAGQVVDAVESRFAAARQPGVAVNLAGQALPRWSAGGTDAGAQERMAALSGWLRGGRRDGAAGAGYGSRALTARDLLTGTSFSLTARAAGGAGGLVSLWGRGAVSRFDGREGGLSLDGEVASAMLGTDWTREAWTAGLLLSHSRGEGGYRGAGEGIVSSSVTGLYPYGRFMVNPRVTLWGVAGYGAGTLTLTPKTLETDMKDSPIRTGMALTMAAAGVRGVAFAAPAEGGFELAVTSDAMVARTSSEKTAGLVAAEAEAIRLRLGLEGSWRGIALGGGALTPRLETAMRHDGGDAETGFGLDLGGGLAWSHPVSGISADLSGRGLLTHEAGGFRERGLSGSFAWDPGQGSGRGPKLALTQTLGASASGGMDALLGRETPAGLTANDNPGSGAGGDELQPPAGTAAGLRLPGLRRPLHLDAGTRARTVERTPGDEPRLAAQPGPGSGRAGAQAGGDPARGDQRQCGPGARHRLQAHRQVI